MSNVDTTSNTNTTSNKWPSFDQLVTMNERDPKELEAFRRARVEALIESAPKQYRRRLRGLQFQIDCTIRKHKTPLGSCISVTKLMQESLARLNQALHTSNPALKNELKEQTPRPSAQILPFNEAG